MKNVICIAALLLSCTFVQAQPVATADYYASGSFVVPANVTAIRIEVWGGGGGAGSTCYSGRIGGNGGNGGVNSAAFNVYPGMVLAIEIGQGGRGACGGGGGGGGGNAYVTGYNISIAAYGGGGGEGTGGGCNACGGNGGTGRALISWYSQPGNTSPPRGQPGGARLYQYQSPYTVGAVPASYYRED